MSGEASEPDSERVALLEAKYTLYKHLLDYIVILREQSCLCPSDHKTKISFCHRQELIRGRKSPVDTGIKIPLKSILKQAVSP